MSKSSYHHGNLREALVRQGLLMLTEQGQDKLSLRELAKRCGVSPAAPYAHFENKDDLLGALRDAVMAELADELRLAAKVHAHEKTVLTDVGMSYVLFFLNNANYFSLLFSEGQHVEAVLWNEEPERNPAFTALCEAAEPILSEFGIPGEGSHNILVAMWALAHGLAAIVCTRGVAERLLSEPDPAGRLRAVMSAFAAPPM